jgi:hypothetical protein
MPMVYHQQTRDLLGVTCHEQHAPFHESVASCNGRKIQPSRVLHPTIGNGPVPQMRRHHQGSSALRFLRIIDDLLRSPRGDRIADHLQGVRFPSPASYPYHTPILPSFGTDLDTSNAHHPSFAQGLCKRKRIGRRAKPESFAQIVVHLERRRFILPRQPPGEKGRRTTHTSKDSRNSAAGVITEYDNGRILATLALKGRDTIL